MPRQTTAAGSIVLSNSTAFVMCDGLLRMSHCLIVELPEPELREIRYILDTLLVKTDLVLDSMERDISFNLEGLSIDSDFSTPPETEDFGAVLVSTTVTTDAIESYSTPSTRRRGTINSTLAPSTAPSPPPVPASSPVPVRAPTPVPEPIPVPIPSKTHGRYPLVLSSRDNVGFPDYTYHPHFICPGIPGTYRSPPARPGNTNIGPYYVITRGLYVGIFTVWDEIDPWVSGIPGSFHRQVKSWEIARDIYNACLASGAVQLIF